MLLLLLLLTRTHTRTSTHVRTHTYEQAHKGNPRLKGGKKSEPKIKNERHKMQLAMKTQVSQLIHVKQETRCRHRFCVTELYALAGRAPPSPFKDSFCGLSLCVMYQATLPRLRGLDRFASVLNLSSA